jgi:hypothetical protein
MEIYLYDRTRRSTVANPVRVRESDPRSAIRRNLKKLFASESAPRALGDTCRESEPFHVMICIRSAMLLSDK